MSRLRDERMTEPTLEDFISRLNDPDPDVRRNSAWVLGRQRDAQVVTPLIDTLNDAAPEVRIRAAEALGNFRGEDIVEALMSVLPDETEPRVREQMILSIGLQGDYQALPLLQTILCNDEAEQVRVAAAEALGKLPIPDSIDALIIAMTQDRGDVPFHAAKALAQIGGKPTVDALLKLLEGDTDPVTRTHSAEILGQLYDKRAIDPLKKMLDDPDEGVQAATKWALKQLGE